MPHSSDSCRFHHFVARHFLIFRFGITTTLAFVTSNQILYHDGIFTAFDQANPVEHVEAHLPMLQSRLADGLRDRRARASPSAGPSDQILCAVNTNHQPIICTECCICPSDQSQLAPPPQALTLSNLFIVVSFQAVSCAWERCRASPAVAKLRLHR
jgi:hypothetical protein